MKACVIALVLASLLVCGTAAETGRSLQQQQVKFDCNGAKRMAGVKNACGLLCGCAGSLNAKVFGSPAGKTACANTCNACLKAAQTCPAGSGLPDACKAGANMKEVNSCINTFLRSQSG